MVGVLLGISLIATVVIVVAIILWRKGFLTQLLSSEFLWRNKKKGEMHAQ